jgi:DNA repair exonuclease SbcCD ATPase subunit
MGSLVEFLQHNAALFTALGGIATVLGLAFTFYKASHDKQIRSLEKRIEGLEKDLSEVNSTHKTQVQGLEGQIKTTKDERAKDIQNLKDELARNGATHDKQVQSLEGQIKAMKGEYAKTVAQYKAVYADAKTKFEAMVAHWKRAKELAEDLQRQLEERVNAQQKDAETFGAQIQQLTQECLLKTKKATDAETNAGQLAIDVQESKKLLEELTRQLDQVIIQDERVWERPVTVPPFLPLSRRVCRSSPS